MEVWHLIEGWCSLRALVLAMNAFVSSTIYNTYMIIYAWLCRKMGEYANLVHRKFLLFCLIRWIWEQPIFRVFGLVHSFAGMLLSCLQMVTEVGRCFWTSAMPSSGPHSNVRIGMELDNSERFGTCFEHNPLPGSDGDEVVGFTFWVVWRFLWWRKHF